MRIKRHSKGTPEKMLQAFESRIDELEENSSIESATNINASKEVDEIWKAVENDYKGSEVTPEILYKKTKELYPYNYTDILDILFSPDNYEWYDMESANEWYNYMKDKFNYIIPGLSFDSIESATDTDVKSFDNLKNKVLRKLKSKGYNTNDTQVIDYADGVTDLLIHSKDKDVDSWYNNTVRNYPDDLKHLPKIEASKNIRQQDYDTLVSQGMSPEEAWAEIETYSYADDYDDIQSATQLDETDDYINADVDSTYTEALRNYFTQLPNITTTSKIYDDEISVLVTLIPNTDYEIEGYFDLDDNIVDSLIDLVEGYIEDKCDTDNDLYSQELADLFPEYVSSSIVIPSADDFYDLEYFEKLCDYITTNLDDAGYGTTAYIKDDYLVIESLYDSDSQFIQPLDEIEPNWDDIDFDAQQLSDAYMEKYEYRDYDPNKQ